MDTPANHTQPARSSFVSVLAWIFIVMSGFSTLISILQNIMINTFFPLDQMQATMHDANGRQAIPPAAEFMMSHFRLFFGVFLAVSAFTLATSIALLKRKNWARLVFIGLLGLGIVWNIGGLFIQQAMFSSMALPPVKAPVEFQSTFKTMMTVMSVFSLVVAIAFSVLFGWIIKRLVSPEIRHEFEADPQSAVD